MLLHIRVNLSVHFRTRADISRIIDVYKRQVLGPSGCGKTTLLNIIGGLDQYTSGELIISGRSTRDFSARDWDTYRNYSCLLYTSRCV